MQPHLSACPSPVHRALLGLLPAALGHEPAPGLDQDLRDSDPFQLADAAQAEFVQTVVAPAFDHFLHLRDSVPEDLLIFFQEIRRGNAEYNALARRELARIGEILQAEGLDCCVVKGGAELVAPVWSDPAGRFISDLDILVAEPGGQALQAFLDAGATGLLKSPEVRELSAKEKHFPAFKLPDGKIGIELHTRVLRGAAEALLPASEILAQSQETDLPGIRVPDLRHRMMHHVLHAQVDHQYYKLNEIKPRSIVDHVMFRQAVSVQDLSEIHSMFEKAGFKSELRSLDAITDLIFDPDGSIGPEDDWVKKSLGLYGQPDRREKSNYRKFVLSLIWRAIFNKESRQYYLQLLGSPRRLRQVWRENVDRIRQRSR